MSGRDVRRLAARATTMTHEAKRNMVARIAVGADALGVTDIYVAREPYRVASGALELLDLKARVHVLDLPIHNNASDTERAVNAFVEAGCRTFVSLGGDGTNRAIIRAQPDIDLIPLSTGTNNVFPVLAEPTIAGMVAGLNATVRLDPDLKRRAKILHVSGDAEDIGLIDVVLLRDDHVGNYLPFETDKLAQIVLTRAEPNSVGMSPIGGLIEPVGIDDDVGLNVMMGGSTKLTVPISPGLFTTVSVDQVEKVAFDQQIVLSGPGVLALDGDRDHQLDEEQSAIITIRRDGPKIIPIERAMAWAAKQNLFATKIA